MEEANVDRQGEPSCSKQQQFDCYVIVYNVSKHSNVGTLLRSCTAFGVKAVSQAQRLLS